MEFRGEAEDIVGIIIIEIFSGEGYFPEGQGSLIKLRLK